MTNCGMRLRVREEMRGINTGAEDLRAKNMNQRLSAVASVALTVEERAENLKLRRARWIMHLPNGTNVAAFSNNTSCS